MPLGTIKSRVNCAEKLSGFADLNNETEIRPDNLTEAALAAG
jgi:hypothetical protein